MLAPNTLLQDRYLVSRLLGQGGMGTVYQATDRKFGNTVAVKETFYSDPQMRQAFSQEARLLNGLRHPALPVVMDYFASAPSMHRPRSEVSSSCCSLLGFRNYHTKSTSPSTPRTL